MGIFSQQNNAEGIPVQPGHGMKRGFLSGSAVIAEYKIGQCSLIFRPVSDDDIKFALFGGGGEITAAMYREVKEFAALVKLREEMKKMKE